MKPQQVSVKFSTPRYRALCYYLEKEGKNIEGELQKKLEEMYRDQVPKDVQEYVKAQNPGEDMDEDQNADPKSSKRQSAKQKAEAPEATIKAFIDKKGIDNLRHLFGTEIFSEDLDNAYKEQTEYRNLLNADARDEISALADKIKNGLADNGEFVIKFVALAKRMQSVTGKKVYGYLPKSVKAMVNELVDLLEKDEDIERIYELWYQAKCAVYGTYTDNPPPKKPLSQEEAFKPIRNAMIKEADELGKILFDLDNDPEEQTEETPEESDNDKSSKGGGLSHTSHNTGSNTQTANTAQPKSHSNYTAARNGYIATSITRFGNSLSRIFRDRFDEQAKHAPMGVDSRLKREIEAKKKGQNISM